MTPEMLQHDNEEKPHNLSTFSLLYFFFLRSHLPQVPATFINYSLQAAVRSNMCFCAGVSRLRTTIIRQSGSFPFKPSTDTRNKRPAFCVLPVGYPKHLEDEKENTLKQNGTCSAKNTLKSLNNSIPREEREPEVRHMGLFSAKDLAYFHSLIKTTFCP